MKHDQIINHEHSETLYIISNWNEFHVKISFQFQIFQTFFSK